MVALRLGAMSSISLMEWIMTSRWLLTVALGLTAAGGTGAQAQVSRPYYVVASGRTLEVAKYTIVNPDCSSMGRTAVNLVEAARAGEVRVGSAGRYMAYASGNPRAACNRRRIPTTVVTYRSMPGFVGQDTFVIEAIFPTGIAQRARITVNVR
jgi:hypothetical protein